MGCQPTQKQERPANTGEWGKGGELRKAGEEMVAALLVTFIEMAKIRNRKLCKRVCRKHPTDNVL